MYRWFAAAFAIVVCVFAAQGENHPFVSGTGRGIVMAVH